MSMLKRVFCVLLTVVMLHAGAAHFTMTAAYVAIMPSFLPFPLALVYLSGVLEIVLGLGLQVPALRRLAAWGLVALLIAVLPANINQAVHNLQPEGLQMSQTMLWVRIPMQLVFLAWAFWMTRPQRQAG